MLEAQVIQQFVKSWFLPLTGHEQLSDNTPFTEGVTSELHSVIGKIKSRLEQCDEASLVARMLHTTHMHIRAHKNLIVPTMPQQQRVVHHVPVEKLHIQNLVNLLVSK